MSNYHDKYKCQKCGGENEITKYWADGGYISECLTKCKSCSGQGYWLYGFFESEGANE